MDAVHSTSASDNSIALSRYCAARRGAFCSFRQFPDRRASIGNGLNAGVRRQPWQASVANPSPLEADRALEACPRLILLPDANTCQLQRLRARSGRPTLGGAPDVSGVSMFLWPHL